MRKPAKTAAVLVGLGVGAMVGSFLGPAAVWVGAAVAALGVGLSLVGTSASDLVGDGPADRRAGAGADAGDGDGDGDGTNPESPASGRRRKPEPVTFAHLGPRVEELLRIAEEQAEDVRAEARREAERIEAAARQEAETILDRAREEAAGVTATGPHLPSGPLSWTRPPGESPSSHA